ncbi:MAG: molybdopterin-dependent oxidoreductase [Candidatus Eremiobacteraeota bacterium]|nr:molybdopterin-dependent oxidoreductase [Candidatus Eremiobacteraeota bacterium]
MRLRSLRTMFIVVAAVCVIAGFRAVERATPTAAYGAEPTPAVSAAPLGTQPTAIPAAPGSIIQVVGDVALPRVFGLKDLQQMRRSSVTIGVDDPDGKKRVHTFTGVLLRDVLSAAKPTTSGGTDTAAREYAVVLGLDGSSATVSFPEFEPVFNGKQILVAYLIDGAPLPIRGIAELVVPEDATRGHFIPSITRIEVGSPAP